MTLNAVPITGSTVRSTRAIAAAAAKTGVAFDYLLSQAKLESGLDPAARATTSSAAGLFQFTRSTWLDVVDRHGAEHGLAWAANAVSRENGRAVVIDPSARSAIEALRFDPEASAAMGAAYASDNRTLLGATLARDPDEVELYLAHFLGPDGATRFIQANEANPGRLAADLFPAAAVANQAIFHRRDGGARTVAEVKELLSARLDAARPGSAEVAWSTQDAASSPPASWTSSRRTSSAAVNLSQPMELRAFTDIPDRPSLEFATSAYRRLSAIGR